MGGGGSWDSLSPEQLKKLEDTAKKSIRETEPAKRSVFISFAGEDLDEVNLLRGQAKNDNTDLEFIDRSIKEPFDSKNKEYIQRGIRERIKQSSVLLCYLTNDAAKSQWVDWEIREAKALGKGVLAMYKGDSPPANLPLAIKEFKIKLVPWNHEKLSKAIDDVAKTKEKP